MMYLSTDVNREDSAGINYTINNTLLSQPALTVIAGSGHYQSNDKQLNTYSEGVYAIGYQMCTTDQEKVCYISYGVILPYDVIKFLTILAHICHVMYHEQHT